MKQLILLLLGIVMLFFSAQSQVVETAQQVITSAWELNTVNNKAIIVSNKTTIIITATTVKTYGNIDRTYTIIDAYKSRKNILYILDEKQVLHRMRIKKDIVIIDNKKNKRIYFI